MIKSSLQAFDTLEKRQGFRKNFLWSAPRPSVGCEELYQTQRDAVLCYMLRQLGRGYVHDPDLILATFNGASVPTCSYIGCLTIDEHVH